MSVETMSGEGKYQITFHNGHALLIEIWRDGARMAFGKPLYHGPCARCGITIPVFVPGNETMEVCDDCEKAVAVEHDEPQIDTWFADIAFLEVDGSTATKVKAALWAWLNLRDKSMSLNQIRHWLMEQGFTLVQR